jgi:NTE family protein
MKTHVFHEGEFVIQGVRASCALPGLFQPLRMDKMMLFDGGIRDDLAIASVQPGERVLCHFLQKSGRPNIFERRSLAGVAGFADVLVRTLSDRVLVAPHLLHRGEAAFEESYVRTREWLGD